MNTNYFRYHQPPIFLVPTKYGSTRRVLNVFLVTLIAFEVLSKGETLSKPLILNGNSNDRDACIMCAFYRNKKMLQNLVKASAKKCTFQTSINHREMKRETKQDKSPRFASTIQKSSVFQMYLNFTRACVCMSVLLTFALEFQIFFTTKISFSSIADCSRRF